MESSYKILNGKTAVITGCLKGIGKATMDLFAEHGADIFACCQFETDDFKKHIKDLIDRTKVHIIPVYFDLCSKEEIINAVKAIRSAKKPIDILVNIAGMTRDALFHMITVDQIKSVFEVNFFSQMVLTQYITKLMIRNKKGSVINISSITAIDGNIGQLSYSSSKAALIGATKTLSMELAPFGIRINAIAPGVIDTEMTKDLKKETKDRLMDKSALKHLGTPRDIAGAILFLASDMSSYITGQVIRVDGGIG